MPLLRHLLLLGCLALALGLAGCANHAGALHNAPPAPTLEESLGDAADGMLTTFPALGENGPVVVAASLIDLEAPETSSTFGRLAAEATLAALAEGGVATREVLLEGAGVLRYVDGLSSPRQRVLQRPTLSDADALLLGTYAQGEQRLYVTLRVVAVADASILASARLSLVLDDDLRRLLRQR